MRHKKILRNVGCAGAERNEGEADSSRDVCQRRGSPKVYVKERRKGHSILVVACVGASPPKGQRAERAPLSSRRGKASRSTTTGKLAMAGGVANMSMRVIA